MLVFSKLLFSIGARRNLGSCLARFKPVRCLGSNSKILDSGQPDVHIPKVSIPEFVLSTIVPYEKLTAMECGITGRKYTFGDIRKKSRNLAKSLRKKLNLAEGDVIAVLLPNIPEFPIILLGTLEAGLVLTTINPIYTPEEISRQLADSSAKALITLTESWNVAQSAKELLKKKLPILTIKTGNSESLPRGAINFWEFTENTVDFPEIRPRKPEEVALLPYSSGTTGLPKGVELTHNNIVAHICQNLNNGLIEDATESHQDVSPAILPMFHIYGLTVLCLNAICKGCKNVTLPKFTSEQYISILEKHQPQLLCLAPPVVLFLTNNDLVKRHHLQSIRSILCGAAPLAATDEQRFLEKANKNINVLQGYGLTEASPTVAVTTIALNSEMDTSGSVGRPVPNTLVKVIDIKTQEALGPNCSGELLVKGPQVMKGYYNNPEETKKAFLDGWLRTGDLVHYDEKGVLYITDRLKELIKVKGFQVAPAELEEIIRDFPNVNDAAVIGVPHPIHGEVPRAYVVGERVDVAKLEEYVAKRAAEYKRLRGGVALVKSIPKNLSGKILRRKLKIQYENENLNNC